MPKRGFRNFNQRGGQSLDTQAFMESNSTVARAAFVVLVLLMCFSISSWFEAKSK